MVFDGIDTASVLNVYVRVHVRVPVCQKFIHVVAAVTVFLIFAHVLH